MKVLETEFVSGEGGYSFAPLTYRQIKRTSNHAIYERSRDGKVKDYEVIRIKVLPKGFKIFKQVLEDDEERYPSTSQFGIIAWSCGSLENALNKFAKLERLYEEKQNNSANPRNIITAENK